MGQERILDTRGGGKGRLTEGAESQDLTSEVPDVDEALASIDAVLKRSKAAQREREAYRERQRSCCGGCCGS